MLHRPAEIRLTYSRFSGADVVKLLQQMAVDANGGDSAHTVISWIEEDDEFVVGTYVPEIHLILRKVDE